MTSSEIWVRLLLRVSFGVGFSEGLQFRGFIQSRFEKVRR